MMPTQLTSSEAFWIVVDVVLAAGLALVATRYVRSRLKNRPRTATFTVSPASRRLVDAFDSMLEEAGPEAAVAGSFKLILSSFLELDGGDYSAGMTVRELADLGLRNLSDTLRAKLLEAYSIYEPVVYGGQRPDKSMLDRFKGLLAEAERLVEAHATGGQA